jgi:hypothetical protein
MLPARLVLALVASAVVVGMAPFVAEVRDLLKQALGPGFAPVLGAFFALALAGAVGWAALRLRGRDRPRYGLLALALVLMLVQVVGSLRGDAAVGAVERFHFLFYGALSVLYFRAFAHYRRGVAAGLTLLSVTLVAVADEGLQWLVPVRTGEIADIGLNAWAGVCLVLACLAVAEAPAATAASHGRPALLRLLAATLVALALYVQIAHLGYLVEDAEIGGFRSYFTREELLLLDELRAEQWARHPPRQLRAMEVEDYFRTEAGWHVLRRNEALQQGDFTEAHRENELLERYYPAFLAQKDTAGRYYALNDNERSRVERGRAAAGPEDWQSTVFREPPRVWLRPSKPLLWGVAGVAALGLLAWAEVVQRKRDDGEPG